MSAPHPHQQLQWDACLARLREGRLPHALLVHGEAGVGVEDFSQRLAGVLLCLENSSESKEACGHCRACILYASGNHPDFHAIGAAKEGGEIKVGQIRELLSFLQISRHYSAFKTVLIHNADEMNLAAANSFLKMLEEPPGNTVMVLASCYPFRLPATVRSRCQSVRLNCLQPLMAGDAAEREEFRADMHKLAAQRVNAADVAERWHEYSVKILHQWLLEIIEEVLRHEFEAPQGLSLSKLFKLHDRQKWRYRSLKVRLNPRLLLESALIEWQLACPNAQGHHPRASGNPPHQH